MNKFGDLNSLKKLTDIDIIKKFKDELLKYKNIGFHFTKFLNNFQIINDVMTNDLNRAELSKNKIALILNNSEFTPGYFAFNDNFAAFSAMLSSSEGEQI